MKVEKILNELPEDLPIMINRIHSSRKKDRTTQLWVIEVGNHKVSNHDLMTALQMVRDKCNGNCPR